MPTIQILAQNLGWQVSPAVLMLAVVAQTAVAATSLGVAARIRHPSSTRNEQRL